MASGEPFIVSRLAEDSRPHGAEEKGCGSSESAEGPLSREPRTSSPRRIGEPRPCLHPLLIAPLLIPPHFLPSFRSGLHWRRLVSGWGAFPVFAHLQRRALQCLTYGRIAEVEVEVEKESAWAFRLSILLIPFSWDVRVEPN